MTAFCRSWCCLELALEEERRTNLHLWELTHPQIVEPSWLLGTIHAGTAEQSVGLVHKVIGAIGGAPRTLAVEITSATRIRGVLSNWAETLADKVRGLSRSLRPLRFKTPPQHELPQWFTSLPAQAQLRLISQLADATGITSDSEVEFLVSAQSPSLLLSILLAKVGEVEQVAHQFLTGPEVAFQLALSHTKRVPLESGGTRLLAVLRSFFRRMDDRRAVVMLRQIGQGQLRSSTVLQRISQYYQGFSDRSAVAGQTDPEVAVRNAQMLRKVLPLLKAGRVLILVGLAHVHGVRGMLSLLKAQGFTPRRLGTVRISPAEKEVVARRAGLAKQAPGARL